MFKIKVAFIFINIYQEKNPKEFSIVLERKSWCFVLLALNLKAQSKRQ